jgi:hypothetical protein
MDAGLSRQASQLTSTQIGAVGEAVVAGGLILASAGQLAPFKPFADDDGTDLLLFDKLTKRAVPLQIKCRMKVDDTAAQTVQFDVRLKTLAQEGRGFILAVLLEGMAVRTAWFIPAQELMGIARATPTKLIIVASAKPDSQDRFRPFRHESLASVAQALLVPTGLAQ